MAKQQMGVMGLGVMGKNLALTLKAEGTPFLSLISSPRRQKKSFKKGKGDSYLALTPPRSL
jgi:6-phosphogluconate dehydrogenase